MTTTETEQLASEDTWTRVDQEQAWAEGWDVFQLDNGYMNIQALDDPEQVCQDAGIVSKRTFEGSYRDYEATMFVRKKAWKRKPLHIKAIRLIENNNQRPWDDGCLILGKTEVSGYDATIMAAYCITHSMWFKMEPLPDDRWEIWFKNDPGVRERLEGFNLACR